MRDLKSALLVSVIVGMAVSMPADDSSQIGPEILFALADGNEGLRQGNDRIPLQDSEGTDREDTEGFARFMLTQVSAVMCYRTREINPLVDFYECSLCFNSTQLPQSQLSKEEHITKVEMCFDKYISGTEYSICYPMLRDPTILNKPYDILPREPPFDYTYRNYLRCTQGVAYKHQAQNCVGPSEKLEGVEQFLAKFSCLANNLVIENRRFVEDNANEVMMKSMPLNETTI